ncbi:MAG TPA: hypothetical protein VGH97_03190 [Thermoanaerobaculia bacterium]|jgi:hypothetical protein
MNRWSRFGMLAAGLIGAAAAARAAGTDNSGFSVSVLVDGVPAPEYAGRGRIYIEALRGREFTIRLQNPTSERVAVALSVDGRNVVDAGRTSAQAAAKWILMPYQTTEIPGWQVSGQTSRKFFFTDTSRSYAKWLGDTANVGTIEAVFFREKPRPPIAAYKDQPSKDEPYRDGARNETAQAPSGDARGGAPGAPLPKAEARRKAVEDAESFAATGIGRETSFPVQWVAFDEDPHPAARVAIRYEFHEQLVRLGVLPRQDDLYARENASGFDHRYAPDPYGHR